MCLALQQQGRRGLLRHIEIALRTGHAMLALLKEVVGAIAVAKVIILPRLSCSEPTSNRVLIDQNLNSAKVTGFGSTASRLRKSSNEGRGPPKTSAYVRMRRYLGPPFKSRFTG